MKSFIRRPFSPFLAYKTEFDLRNIIFFVVIGLVILSCREIRDCQLNDETDFFVIRFFDRDTTTLDESVRIDDISIEGVGSIGLSDTTLSALGLFVNDFDTTTTYFFQTSEGLDTLTVCYESEFFIFFEDCAPAQRFFDFKVIRHTFDSLIVNDTILNRDFTDNVRIFLD